MIDKLLTPFRFCLKAKINQAKESIKPLTFVNISYGRFNILRSMLMAVWNSFLYCHLNQVSCTREHYRTPYSSVADCFEIINQFHLKHKSIQLKLKEAVHINKKMPDLSQQDNHVNLTLHFMLCFFFTLANYACFPTSCYKFVRQIETRFTDTEILKKISWCFLKLAKNIGPQFCKCSLKRLNISIFTSSTHEH